MIDPVVLIVARASIEGAPTIQLEAPMEVRVRKAEPVVVKFLYRFEEQSVDREAWKFRLKSKVGGREPAPAEAKWKDRRLQKDQVWGFVEHQYSFPDAGLREGTFEVEATYERSKWGGAAPSSRAVTKSGTFRIRVE